MKRTSRAVIIAVSAILFIPIVLLTRHFLDLGDQYSALTYLRASLAAAVFHDPPKSPPSIGVEVEDKVVVIGKMESEDTDWVSKELPSWQRAIYTVNPSISTTLNETLTTPMNKGHEAMAYLTYIIDNYDSLPSIMAFLHPHNSGFLSAWHVDTPLHSNSDALNSLHPDIVQKNGYVNLRCNWNPGCIEEHLVNKFVTADVWRQIFRDTTTSQDYPPQVGAACCAQFAVSRPRVLERPLSDYEKLRQWIIETDETDRISGRIFEYLWHVIFGMQPVHCPDVNTCYCEVYGRCQ